LSSRLGAYTISAHNPPPALLCNADSNLLQSIIPEHNSASNKYMCWQKQQYKLAKENIFMLIELQVSEKPDNPVTTNSEQTPQDNCLPDITHKQ